MRPSSDRHATTSALEGALCEELQQQSVAHEHRSLHFRVHLPSGETYQYEPCIAVRRGSILFLIEPLGSGDDDGHRLEFLAAFLDQHSPEIVLVVVAAKDQIPGIPPACYDEVYPASKLAAVVRRIRWQNPQGMIRPFPKTNSRAGL
jgi:hypothetical protein